MKFKQLLVTATSATFELDNQDIYYSSQKYDVFIDGKKVIENHQNNIFSVYDLKPNTRYQISILYNDEKTSLDIYTKKILLTINVKDCGAKGDGESIDTSFIQTAINIAPKGARVLLPAGTYLSGPIFMKSDITFELEEGAKLLGLSDRKLYPYLPGYVKFSDGSDEFMFGTWEGEVCQTFASLITCHGVENVEIIGLGIVDGNAQNSDFWIDHKNIRIAARPRLIFIKDSKNITLQGITVTNSPSWTIHPFFSEGINVIDVKVINPKISPNTDGCNPEACSDVKIIGVLFSVGDDCIAIKSGKIDIGMKYQRPTQNLTIRNCLMQFGHGAVVLGSEMSGGIKNLVVERCYFKETDRGLRVKTRRGRGKYAIIDGIKFENIYMKDVLAPLVINMFYYCDIDGKTEYVYSKEKLPIDDRTPFLGKFHFKNVKVDDAHYCAGFFYGLPERKIKEIILENVDVNYSNNAESGIPAMMSFIPDHCKSGLSFNCVEKVQLKNVNICGQTGPKIIKNDLDSIEE